jgi:predicted type IV restriction endonuclease
MDTKLKENKKMTAIQLVETLAGAHYCHPAEMVETIKSNPAFWAIVRKYGKGEATYEQVLATSKQFI